MPTSNLVIIRWTEVGINMACKDATDLQRNLSKGCGRPSRSNPWLLRQQHFVGDRGRLQEPSVTTWILLGRIHWGNSHAGRPSPYAGLTASTVHALHFPALVWSCRFSSVFCWAGVLPGRNETALLTALNYFWKQGSVHNKGLFLLEQQYSVLLSSSWSDDWEAVEPGHILSLGIRV